MDDVSYLPTPHFSPMQCSKCFIGSASTLSSYSQSLPPCVLLTLALLTSCSFPPVYNLDTVVLGAVGMGEGHIRVIAESLKGEALFSRSSGTPEVHGFVCNFLTACAMRSSYAAFSLIAPSSLMGAGIRVALHHHHLCEERDLHCTFCCRACIMSSFSLAAAMRVATDVARPCKEHNTGARHCKMSTPLKSAMCSRVSGQ